MLMTRKSRLATQLLLQLIDTQRPVCLRTIAPRLYVSQSYLEQLTVRLVRAGLVSARRGPGGGYDLTMSADAITFKDIIDAVENPEAGPFDPAYDRLSSHVRRLLDAITLAQIKRMGDGVINISKAG